MGTPTYDPNTPLEVRLGHALGAHYEVRRLIGRGGFAEVFEVWDLQLQRRLAVKVLRPDVAWTSGMLDRFRHEARAVARLNHPNILPIHFVGDGEGLVYYAMPFVEGKSLGDHLRATPEFGIDRALDIIKPVLDALQHAHERGLVHRDIKPDNIMIDITTQRPLLVDFGIAKQVDGEKGLTQTGFVVGTPQYMSPEQALGETNLDGRSDLYAIGAVLYQMVTGSPPFDGDTSQEIVAKHISEMPVSPASRNARIPVWLSDVIVRCLQKAPNNRYQSAAAVVDALEAGGRSGDTASVSAEQVARNIQSEATEIVPTQERVSSGAPKVASDKKKSHVLRNGVLLLAIAGAGFFGMRTFLSSSVTFRNDLQAPVRISLTGVPEDTLAAGAELRLPVSRGEPFSVNWQLLRPETPSGRPMGVEVHGAVAEQDASGRYEFSATASTRDSSFFAPLITNNTEQPLEVIVNYGLAGAMSCGCEIMPGVARSMVGYYPLYQNSTVRVQDADGRWAMFRDIGRDVDRVSGIVSLRFEESNLSAPQ